MFIITNGIKIKHQKSRRAGKFKLRFKVLKSENESTYVISSYNHIRIYIYSHDYSIISIYCPAEELL